MREEDTRGERERLSGRPIKIVLTRILSVRIFPIRREASEGKSNRAYPFFLAPTTSKGLLRRLIVIWPGMFLEDVRRAVP